MELLKVTKFKLQLRALIADVHELKERERSTNDQLSVQLHKQKQSEEEFTKKIQVLEAEICGLLESNQKLQRKVNYLQNDNVLLESKQKELKEAVNNLLQSRECFINAYQESTAEMKRSLEARDRKIAMMSEKISSHLMLFDSIQKEALCVKRLVDKVECTVAEKENIVEELKRKMKKVASFEELFEEKISLLESKSRDQGKDLLAKNKIIMELEAQLEVAKTRKKCNSEIEDLQSAVSAKEILIENLMHEKEVSSENSNAFRKFDWHARGISDSQIENSEGCTTSRLYDNYRMDCCLTSTTDSAHHKRIKFSCKLCGGGSAEPIQEHDMATSPLKKNKGLSNCLSESACSVSQKPSEAPCTTNDSEKVLVGPQVVVIDSESSSTQT